MKTETLERLNGEEEEKKIEHNPITAAKACNENSQQKNNRDRNREKKKGKVRVK